MTAPQALQLLVDATGRMQLNRADHEILNEAIQVLEFTVINMITKEERKNVKQKANQDQAE